MKIKIVQTMVIEVPEFMQDLWNEAVAAGDKDGIEELIGDIEHHYGYESVEMNSFEEVK